VSGLKYKLADVYTRSAASVQTSIWIGVIKRGLEHVKCIVLSGVLCYAAMQRAAQSVWNSIGR